MQRRKMLSMDAAHALPQRASPRARFHSMDNWDHGPASTACFTTLWHGSPQERIDVLRATGALDEADVLDDTSINRVVCFLWDNGPNRWPCVPLKMTLYGMDKLLAWCRAQPDMQHVFASNINLREMIIEACDISREAWAGRAENCSEFFNSQ